MSIWAICSRLAPGSALLLLLGTPGTLCAQISLQEALTAAFPPPAIVERKTAFLDPMDLAAIRTAAGADVPVTQRVVSYYLATRDGRPIGVAYFDSHRVRTLNEVVMIVVEPGDSAGCDRIRSIEVLRFAEPPEYHARDAWLNQFKGRRLSKELSLKEAIPNMTGATLTSNAIVRASRRVLATHQRIKPWAAPARAAP
jgi:Na+-translocating ferredoxin:NAD+ oxidoreductase RnfG subunit